MEKMNELEENVEYIVSIYPSKFHGYQYKKQKNGIVKSYISTIWEDYPNFDIFTKIFCVIQVQERYCLERAFQRIRIKGGACKPCCTSHLADENAFYLFGLEQVGGHK